MSEALCREMAVTLEWTPQRKEAGNINPGSGSDVRQQPGPSAFLTVGTALRVQLHAVRSGAPAPADAARPRAQVRSRRCGDGPSEGGGAGPPWPVLQACSLQASGPLLRPAAALRTPSPPRPEVGAQCPRLSGFPLWTRVGAGSARFCVPTCGAERLRVTSHWK